MGAIDRLYHYLELKNIKPGRLEREIGLSNGYFRTQLKRCGSLGEDVFNKILNHYMDISPEWLLTGNGNMFRREERDDSINESPTSYHVQKFIDARDDISHNRTIPLYQMIASTGFLNFLKNPHENIIDTISIPRLGKADGAMYIYGDTMSPLLKAGDIVIFKQVHNLKFLHYGNIHILSYKLDGDDYLSIKFVHKSDDDEMIRLVSENENSAPLDIPKSSVNAIAIVKASIRFNTLY